MKHYDVAIIGLGPVGSFTALLLEKYGLNVLAIDKEKDIYQLPRAVTISDQGFRMAQLVDIEEIYLNNSTELGGMSFVDGNLDLIGGSIDLEGLITANGWPPSRMFHQPFTDKAIRERLNDSKVTILLESELKNIKNGEDRVEIHIEDANSEEHSYCTCNYLIGSDGGSSEVRKLLKITQKDLEYNRDWVVIDVELNGKNRLSEKALQVCDSERLATYIPAHLPYRRWEFIIHEHEDKREFLDDKKVQGLIGKWLEPDEYKIIRKAVYQFHSVIADNFRKGNCFLIGDAAHQAPPFMGEGMMSGYRDAANLSWKIALTIKNQLNEDLLDSYEIERKPHSEFVVRNSAGIGELMDAYARFENPSEVPEELVQRGYGSFILPDLNKGFFYGGIADSSMGAGQIFPQPVEYIDNAIIERMDKIFGNGFSLVSMDKIDLSLEEENFLKELECNLVILEDIFVANNPWLKSFMQLGDVFVIRPDRYVYGSSNESVTVEMLLEDLKKKVKGINTD